MGGTLLIAQPVRLHPKHCYLNSDQGEAGAGHDAAQNHDLQPSALPVKPATTIMLVEDEPMVRSLLARVLRSRGYGVIEAGDGLEALDLAATLGHPVDLLLTDVVMPRMGGIDLAEQMLAGGYAVRVLYMTGYSDVTLHGIDVNAAVLRKPFAPRVLTDTVQRMLDT